MTADPTPRPSLLLMESDDGRRRTLSLGLAEFGYEVIPVPNVQETLRFARGLGPTVMVGPHILLAEAGGELLELCGDGEELEGTVILLGTDEDPGEVPDAIRYLPVNGLPDEEIRRRIRMVLVGKELGLESDLELRSLVGDLALLPFLELVRSLARCQLTGRVELDSGSLAFDRGLLLAARAHGAGGGNLRSNKAFCRLSRLDAGAFRVFLEPTGARPEFEASLEELMIEAIEEIHMEWPDLRSRLRVADGAATSEDLLHRTVASCSTIGELLDHIPLSDAQALRTLDKMVNEGFLRVEPPRNPVSVVTDSTCDLPPELARAHGIEVVPLSILFGEARMQDGVELRPRDFYRMLETEADHPRTEPPTEDAFAAQYVGLYDERDVLSVHISGKLSQTVVHAAGAAGRATSTRSGASLEVLDSNQVSMGLGLLALFAARLVERGHSAAAARARLEDMTQRIHTLFVVDTLEYLARGGRIGHARAWVGKILGIKPILGVVEGEVTPVDRVRGGRRAHPRIVEILRERLDPKRPIVCAVAHARAPVWADRLRNLLAETFRVQEMILTDIGPVVGTHAGPGCVGTVVFQPTDEERELIAPLG